MTTTAIRDTELAELFRPLAGFSHCGLAVSGGRDSTALMRLAARWRALRGGEAPRLTVLTVDHGLRPGSAREAEFVAGAAAGLGLPHRILRWTGEKPGTGLQAAARAARYDLMAAHAHAHGLDCLATAHHRDDQAETLLMRLARGSGVDGLAGVPERGHWAGIPVLRPLLAVPAERLGATLAAAGAGWCEDPANADARYERARVREALPVLAGLGCSAAALAETARRMRRARAALDAAARAFAQAHVRVCPAGHCEIDRTAFAEAPEETALRVLAMAIETVRGFPPELSLKRLERLTADLRAGTAGARTLGGCRVAPRGNALMVTREPGRGGLETLRLEPGGAALWDRRFAVAAPAEAKAAATVRALGREGLAALRARAGKRVSPPAGAAAAVSFWRDGRLLAAPTLDFRPTAAAVTRRASSTPGCSRRCGNVNSIAGKGWRPCPRRRRVLTPGIVAGGRTA